MEKPHETNHFDYCKHVLQGTKSFVVFIFCCVSFPGRQIETLLVDQAGHQPEASVYDDLGTRPNHRLFYRLHL